MVLDSKALEWASQQGLDTAALKKAKVPIYGKWYFPDLPADTPLVNLQTGATETFGDGFRAGAILYVKEEDLRRANLGPFKKEPAPTPSPTDGDPGAQSEEQVAEAAAPDRPAEAVLGQERPSDELVEAAREVGSSPATAAVAMREPVRMLEEAHGGHAAHDTPPHGELGAHVDVAEHPHPTAQKYVVIALILAVITAMEVAVYYVDVLQANKVVFVLILLSLSVIKFILVVGYFMHLKFDHKMYTGYFAGGLAIAVSIVGALILLFITFTPIPTPALPGMPSPEDAAHSAPAKPH
jgi:cytochrome c oxidase subunit 4